MSHHKTLSIPVPTDQPRNAQQEVVDLLAAALLRLRARSFHIISNTEPVGLGFLPEQSVNATADDSPGERP